jgi:pimeloyl-ACP methyl ester carboxylesterase
VGEFVTVEGVRLHYVSKGAGKPVVLLHGNAGFTHDYSTVMRQLAERGFRALAFDRPGHGLSERPETEIATVEVQARLVRGALLELGVNRPIMVGHSWGGILVLNYALHYRAEISALVLLAPASYPEPEQYSSQRTLVEIPGLGDLIIRVSGPFINWEIRRTLERAFSPDEVPLEYLELATALWNRPGQIRAIIQDEADYGRTAEALSNRYGEIDLPTVIITGDADLLVNSEIHAFPLHQAIPQSKLIVLPQTGHMVPQTRPESVTEAVQIVGDLSSS